LDKAVLLSYALSVMDANIAARLVGERNANDDGVKTGERDEET
jgi:hypothetical protein